MSSFFKKLVDRLVVREWLDLPAAQKNTAGGIVVADSEGKIVGPIIPRSGTKAEIDGIVLGLGEVAHYTDMPGGYAVGDGVTAGGWPRLVTTLDSDVEADSDSWETVLSLDIGVEGSIWEVNGFLSLQASNLNDPGNFRVRISGTGFTRLSLGGSNHPFNDPGAPDTTVYQTTNQTEEIGGIAIVAVGGFGELTMASSDVKMELAQVSTDTPTTLALAGKCHLVARRIA